MENREYYLGLDVGTDSVGYAVTDTEYTVRRYKGELMWGVTLFDAASGAADRRAYRTNRRRIDRRQQRTALLEELFAPEILKIDPYFFIRRRESALFPEDTKHSVHIFNGTGMTDNEYHRRYPTIHHLILELMTDTRSHDVRLVYMACAWLVANRGHFLYNIPMEHVGEILKFENVFRELSEYLSEMGCDLPWRANVTPGDILSVLQMEVGVRRKAEAFKDRIFDDVKADREASDGPLLDTGNIITLLSGGKVKPSELYKNRLYAEIDSVSLVMNDDDFARIVSELGDDGEILLRLREVVNCAQLISAMKGASCISEGKARIYVQHRNDLKCLKYFVKKYCPEKYDEIFRDAVADNYACYSKNVKSVPEDRVKKIKFADKDAFCAFIKSA